MTTLHVHTLSRRDDKTIPFDPRMSMIEFQRFLHSQVPHSGGYINEESKTYFVGIVQDGNRLNSPENRHRLVGDLIDPTKPIYLIGMCYNPITSAAVKGNLDETNREIDYTCAICGESTATRVPSHTPYALDCLHRFHLECLGRACVDDACPVCRTPYPNLSTIFRRFAVTGGDEKLGGS
jgi:hypothetical protein